MTDLAQLETQTLAAIEGAGDEAALDVVRVNALGKKGAISALLATLGKMSPDERKSEGAKINALKDRVGEALAARKNLLKEAALSLGWPPKPSTSRCRPAPRRWRPAASIRSAR